MNIEREIDTVPDGVWHDSMSQFVDVHYEQTAHYVGGQRGERASHLLLRREGVAIAGARAAIYGIPGIGRGIALIRFGPFWRRRDEAADFAVYRAAIAELVEEYCLRRKLYLVIRPRPHPEFYPAEVDALNELGFSTRRTSPPAEHYLVDVSLDESTQLKSLDQKWRYNLRQALSNEIEIRFCDDAADTAAFRSLYGSMVERKKLNYAGLDMAGVIPELMILPEAMRLRVALAFHNGQPIAGATVGVPGDMAYYVFGASAENALSLRAGYALQWWIVRWLSTTQSVRWYELGGTGDSGIRQFKKGLIGKRGAILAAGEFDRWISPSSRAAANLIFHLRDLRSALQRWRRRP